MPNYIVTLQQYNGCYNFLCTDRNPYIARKIINKHSDTIEFVGDPDITELTEQEFDLFASKGVKVIVNEMD